MASFRYTVFDIEGKVERGKLEAYNKEQAQKILKDQGYKIEAINEIKETIWNKDLYFGKIVKPREFVVFLRQFQALLKAGLTIVEAIHLLREQTKNKYFHKALYYIEIDLRQGKSLTQAMANHPKIFSEFFRNMIHSGEESGSLEPTLSALADYYHKQHQTNQKMKSTFAYPVTVLVVAIAVVVFLLIYVVPQFVAMFNSYEAELPSVTKFVLGASDFVGNFWWLLLILIIGIISLIYYLFKQEKTGMKMERFLLKLPVIGSILVKSNLASIARSMSSLLGNSVPIIQAMELTENTTSNRIFKKALVRTRHSLIQGGSFAEPLKKHWAFPYMFTEMIAVGERTGSLPEMLKQVASFYEEDLETANEQLKSLLEPLLIITLSVVVGTIILSIIMPMFELFNQIN
ncbi:MULTISPECIES: type II secretion system F family protein [Allobacillus]|uniref:Type II secretion system F family protein n=1 Tax=Allobacillus salarius TaxID=1955272 RepID=A0A556PP82_9BACI|nr:type II secretion system F family protein [Allobacillus salarius]TSJ66188.1 type II secretion system F family protein [Allobacillus salarius]